MIKVILILVTMWSVGCSDMSFDAAPVQNNFSQNITYNNKVDILWIVDNSSSMLKHQQRLGEQIPNLISKLNGLEMDYQMAVVTSSMGGDKPDGGKFIGSPVIVNKKTPNLVNVFRERLIVGESGSNLERGLESMATVLSSPYSSREGVGFIREGALLVVIALSDEEDSSASSSQAAITNYSQLLDNVKKPWADGTRSWLFNFIGVLDLNSQCKTFNDYASAGLSFVGLADYSGGVKESICTTNLGVAVSNIRSRILQILTDFKLTTIPDVETIVVKVAGKIVPQDSQEGWIYIRDLNIIRFNGSSVPGAYEKISIDYLPDLNWNDPV